MKNKRGISDVIATVLIVLLVLAAIAIVWGFVQPTINDAGTAIGASQKCLSAEVVPTSCSSSGVNVQWKKGEIVGAQVFVEEDDGTANSERVSFSGAQILSTATTSTIGTSSGVARAAPIVLNSEEEEVVCDPSPTEINCT